VHRLLAIGPDFTMLSFKGFLMLAMVLAGGLAASQAALNARLSAVIGNPIQASLISFVIGALGLAILLIATRQGMPSLIQIVKVPPHLLLGGLCGGVFITCAIFLVPRIGVVNVLFLGLAGQMLVSIAIDYFGLFGLQRQVLSVVKVVGLVLILAGVACLKLDATKYADDEKVKLVDAIVDPFIDTSIIDAPIIDTPNYVQQQTQSLYKLLPATLSKHGNLRVRLIQSQCRRKQKRMAMDMHNRLACKHFSVVS